MRETRFFGDRVNARGADALFPEQTSGRSQNVVGDFLLPFLSTPASASPYVYNRT